MSLDRQGQAISNEPSSTTVIHQKLSEVEASKLVSSFINSLPVMLPEARPLSDLIFLNKAKEDAQERTSAHQMNEVKLKNSTDPDAIHMYKNVIADHELDNPIVELEDLNEAIGQYLCPYVPDTCAYYDTTNYKYVGITSKKIFNFKSNKEDPLTEKDFIIEVNDLIIDNDKIQKNQKELTESLQTLSEALDRNNDKGIVEKCWTIAANLYNYYVSQSPTAIKHKSEVDQYLAATQNLESSKKLLTSLVVRLKYVEYRSVTLDPEKTLDAELITQYSNEQSALKKVINCLNLLISNPPKTIINNAVLDIFDELDKIMCAKGVVDITEADEHLTMTEKVFGNDYEFSLRALKNYRIIKAMAYIRMLKKEEHEGDDHNRNFGKKGTFDGDHQQEDVTYNFTKHSQFERLWQIRKPNDKTFQFTARDYLILPDSIDSTEFYNPAKQVNIAPSIVTLVSRLYDITKNFFTPEDNVVFKKLAFSPLFIYFKNQNALKFILTDIGIYENIHELHLRKEWKYVEENGEIRAFLNHTNCKEHKSLLSKMNEKKAAKIKEMTDVLITIQQFRDFLSYHGERALKKIIEEVQSYKDKLIKQLPSKPHYQKLIDAIDIEKFKIKYQEICDKALTAAENQKLSTSQQMSNSQKMSTSQMTNSQKLSTSQKMNNSQKMSTSQQMTDSQKINNSKVENEQVENRVILGMG